jgi:thymidylate synthase ThyX
VFKPTSKVLAHSSCTNEPQALVTMELKFHRYVLAEFNTHRMFSRNGASSRAIPTQKLIDLACTAEVQPSSFGKNQPGMQAGGELEAEQLEVALETWEQAKAAAIESASKLRLLGVHKQVVNRLLEPFLPMTVIVTGTTAAWDNFLNQRLHPAAAPEMQELAQVVSEALVGSRPKHLNVGEWHLPYYCSTSDYCYPFVDILRATVGRCARVSYLNHDGKPDVEADISLYHKLATASPAHLSPFEHLAKVHDCTLRSSGNFSGTRWLQLRHDTATLAHLSY